MVGARKLSGQEFYVISLHNNNHYKAWFRPKWWTKGSCWFVPEGFDIKVWSKAEHK